MEMTFILSFPLLIKFLCVFFKMPFTCSVNGKHPFGSRAQLAVTQATLVTQLILRCAVTQSWGSKQNLISYLHRLPKPCDAMANLLPGSKQNQELPYKCLRIGESKIMVLASKVFAPLLFQIKGTYRFANDRCNPPPLLPLPKKLLTVI